MKRFLGLLVSVLLCFYSVAVADVDSIDLSHLTGGELNAFSAQIDEVIELYHTPNNASRDLALSITKNAVESHFSSQGIEVSWPWFDYSYTRSWDLYTLATHMNYKDNNKKSHELDVYAELFPENGQYRLFYLLVGTEVITNRRDSLPDSQWEHQPQSIINTSTNTELSVLTADELDSLKKRISNEYDNNHKPKSSITELVLSLAKVSVERYFEEKGCSVDWAWFDYNYVREWDFYTLTTPITYKDSNDSQSGIVYAEAYPFDGQYSLSYLAIDNAVLLDRRNELPAELYSKTSDKENNETEIGISPEPSLVPTPMPDSTEEITPSPSPFVTLTIENCPELKEILFVKDEFSPSIKSFAAKYRGQSIEFDGNIANTANNGNGSYDILVLAGEYSETSISGPYFQLLGVDSFGFDTGDNIHIIATVKEFRESSGLFMLDLVSLTERQKGQEMLSDRQYETLAPGSKGQAVLDARMKLYELGYFKKKPTQTEYTNNMKDYVVKFEKDYGLEQDGILSPEDQAVLFAQESPTAKPKVTAKPTPTAKPKPTSTPNIALSQAHQDWVENQFSIWNGTHKTLEKLIIKNLNDEKSYKHIETRYIDICDEDEMKRINKTLKEAGYSRRVKIGDLFIITEFSAKNGFNATVKNTAYGIASYEEDTVYLLGIK